MQFRNSPEHYGLLALSFHWLTVALVMVAWTLGTFDDVLPRGAARATGLFVHVTAGVAILTLLLCRAVWQLNDPPPPVEPSVLGAWGDRASHLVHYALYVLLAAVSIAGIVVKFARGNALPLFGLFEIASPWAADRAFARSAKGIHEVLANALVILAVLHAAAALVHHWIFRDRTLARMLPRVPAQRRD